MNNYRITYTDLFEGTFTSNVYASTESSALSILFNDLGFVTIHNIEIL
jgi:hypothetical protein